MSAPAKIVIIFWLLISGGYAVAFEITLYGFDVWRAWVCLCILVANGAAVFAVATRPAKASGDIPSGRAG